MTLLGFVRWMTLGVLLLAGAGGALVQRVAWGALGPGGSGYARAQFFCGDIVSGKSAMAVDSAGNSIVVRCISNLTNDDYLTVRFAPDRSVLWRASNNGSANDNDYPVAVAVDSFGSWDA